MVEPQTYTVVKVAGVTPKPGGQYGDMQSIDLFLHGIPEKVNWYTKASTPVPNEGDTLQGTVEDSEYGKKFKKAKPQNNFAPRAEDPERSRRILRQHSQHMALLTLRLKFPTGLPPDMDLWAAVKAAADWFDKDVQ